MEKCAMKKATKGDKRKKPSPKPPNKPWFYWAAFAIRLVLYIASGGELPL